MRSVWKVDVPVDDRVHGHSLPMGARVVHVASQYGHMDTTAMVAVWLEVDAAAPTILRYFIAFGTGHAVEGEYVGTGLDAKGALVWHIYELPTHDKASEAGS